MRRTLVALALAHTSAVVYLVTARLPCQFGGKRHFTAYGAMAVAPLAASYAVTST